MKKSLFVFFSLFIFLFIFTIVTLNTDFPFTLREAKESYNAYSIIKTGKDTSSAFLPFLFRTDNDFVSPGPVYLRMPFIYIFGLNSVSVRLPSLIAGFFMAYLFYLFLTLINKDSLSVFFPLILFIITPLFSQTITFNLGGSLSLIFLILSIYSLKLKNDLSFFVSLIMAFFFSYESVFVILILLIYKFRKSTDIKSKITPFLIFIVIVSIPFFNKDFGKFISRTSVIKEISPESYTFLIDKRLSFGFLYKSPLINGNFNYNRIAHNKFFYGTEAFFKSAASVFDFEKLVSPTKSRTILDKYFPGSELIQKLYFWEIPLIIAGLILFFKSGNSLLILYAAGTILSLLFFRKDIPYYLLLPVLAMSEALALNGILKLFKKNYLIIFAVSGLIVFSVFNYFDVFFNKWSDWFEEIPFRQHQIWTTITREEITKADKIFVTDRIGEPLYYYLSYHRIDPQLLQNESTSVHIVKEGIKRIDRIGKVKFGSFKYYESPRNKNEIWVGIAGEFAGENKQYGNINNLPDGVILEKFKGIRNSNKNLGDELWIVKTTL